MELAEYSAFAIPGQVTVEEGKGGLPVVKVRNAFAQADIYLHGAHVEYSSPNLPPIPVITCHPAG